MSATTPVIESPSGGLRNARVRRGWSQQRLVAELRRAANHIGVELPAPPTLVSMVSRWERHRVEPNDLYRRLLGIVYGTDAAQLGTDSRVPSDTASRQPPMVAPVIWTATLDHLATLGRPPDLLFGVLPETIGGPLSVQMDALRAVGQRVDAGVVLTVRQLAESARLLDRTFGAGSTAYLLAALWRWMVELRPHAGTAQGRRDLARLGAEIGSLLGWQALTMARPDLALRYYAGATSAAREADNPALHAYVLGESAYVELHAGRPAQALRVVRAAHQIAPLAHHPPELRAWLEAARAEHLAATGRPDDCLRALDRARSHLSTAPASGQIASLAHLDDRHMERWAGSCLARCGRPEAVEVLRTALSRADPSFVRARAALLLDLATAVAAAGDQDEAIHLAGEASQLAVQTGATLQVDRSLHLLDQLTSG